jgi:hypothetical protein
VDVDATALLLNDARGVLVSLINDLDGFYGPFVLAPSTTRAPSLRDARRARTRGRPRRRLVRRCPVLNEARKTNRADVEQPSQLWTRPSSRSV